MKILITVGIYPPDIGGPASFVPKIAKLLNKNNHNVKVVCLTDEKKIDSESYFVRRILRNQNLVIRWIKTVLTIIRHGYNADVIFVNGLPMESYVANIFLRKKIVRKVVGDWAWERGRNKGLTEDSFDEFQINSHKIQLEVAKFARGWTATKADIVITPSIHLSNVVNNWGVDREKIRILYNGTKISNEPILRKDIQNKFKFITVGRLAPFKNIDSIIEAIAELKQVNMDIFLYIVGSGPMEKSLKKLSKDLNLENNILFTGQKTPEELKKYYLDSNIYIQASGYEGLPHVLLEAINYELALISTPIGGSNEVLEGGKNGWLIDLVEGKRPDPIQLSEVMLEVMKSKQSRDIKIKSAKNILKEKFDEENNFNEYIRLLF